MSVTGYEQRKATKYSKEASRGRHRVHGHRPESTERKKRQSCKKDRRRRSEDANPRTCHQRPEERAKPGPNQHSRKCKPVSSTCQISTLMQHSMHTFTDLTSCKCYIPNCPRTLVSSTYHISTLIQHSTHTFADLSSCKFYILFCPRRLDFSGLGSGQNPHANPLVMTPNKQGKKVTDEDSDYLSYEIQTISAPGWEFKTQEYEHQMVECWSQVDPNKANERLVYGPNTKFQAQEPTHTALHDVYKCNWVRVDADETTELITEFYYNRQSETVTHSDPTATELSDRYIVID